MASMIFRRRTVFLTGAGCVLAAALMGMVDGRSRLTDTEPNPQPQYELPECPHDWEFLPKRLGGRVAPEGFSLSGPITDVPEFHDCQKLLTENGRRYGPLVAIFASYELDSLERRLDNLEHSVTNRHISLAAALILNLGEAYAPLNIQPGFSCLYVWRTGGSLGARVWNAKIVWVDTAHSKCIRPIRPDSLPEGDLRVVRDTALGLRADADYPPVARWDWDPINRQQYMGIKCGRGWCEVGRGFNPSQPYATGPSVLRVQRIKGWYDEQILASDVGAPSGIKGTIFPDPGLARRRPTDFDALWVPVAYVALDSPSPYYKARFNFDQVPAGSQLRNMNTLSFCRGPRSRCRVPPTGPSAACGDDARWGGRRWWVRIISAGSKPDTLYRCVTRRGHEHLRKGIPSTARWRWLAEDETNWIECVQGCCQTDAAR